MLDALWLGLKASDWIMIVAVISGPILAVWVTRFHDARQNAASRKQEILRSLLRTRQIRLDPEHVGALNLIEIEFYKHPTVIDRYSSYISHLNRPFPTDNTADAFHEVRNDLFVDLLSSIGQVLGYTFDKHDLNRRAYSPIGWVDDQKRQQRNAALLTELLEGNRSLPVFNMIADRNLFPPPPSQD